jgi:hypothetical protein
MENKTSNFELWPERDVPPFADIKIIGCCEEHENYGEFKWYREHNWQDFKKLILSETEIIESFVDPSSFNSLQSDVWRYYAKGAFSALEEQVLKSESFDDLNYSLWLWLCNNAQNPELSKPEVQDIISLVEKIAALKIEDEADAADLQRTLLFWNNYAKVFG